MTASKYCKEIGLPSLKYLSLECEVGVGTLRNWYNNRFVVFCMLAQQAINNYELSMIKGLTENEIASALLVKLKDDLVAAKLHYGVGELAKEGEAIKLDSPYKLKSNDKRVLIKRPMNNC